MEPIRPKVTPIFQTSVFTFDDLNTLEAYFEQPKGNYMYSRMGNPNTDELAEAVNELEKGDGAVVTSSGMSAILTGILSVCKSGDHVLCAEEIYGGSVALLSNELSRMGISTTYISSKDMLQLAGFVQSNTKLLLTETISNPLISVQDLAALAKACVASGIKLMVDNTFATPVLTRPLVLGADIVIHSVTKYLSGHSDVTAGVVVAKGELATRIKQIVVAYGLNLSPFESWLASRGLKTLHLRVRQHCANAMQIATFLNNHPKVKKIYYSGLEEHPDYKLATEQGKGLYGGMLSFQITDELEKVNLFIRSLKHIHLVPSLAGVSTTLSHPLKTSHRALSAEQQKKLGITTGLIRLSVGIEETDELIADLAQALDKL